MAKGTRLDLNINVKGGESVEKVKAGFEKASENAKNATKSIKNYKLNLMKLVSTIKTVTDLTDSYVTSQRTLNKLFGEGTEKMNKLTNSLSRMTGISKTSLSVAEANFGQMATSLGMSSEMAQDFSEKLTVLTSKLAIMKNLGFTETANAIQKSMKGTVSTTLASISGITITAKSLQQVLDNLGIDAQVSQLNSANLAILKYIAISKQMIASDKEMSSVVNDVAWQKRMLTNQIKEVANAFGNLLYPILKTILPVLNAILMVVANIINVFAGLLSALFGIKKQDSVQQATQGFVDFGNAIEEASNKAKKSLRGFDKLNNITTPTPTTSVGGGAGIDPRLFEAMTGLDQQMLEIRNRATEIADSIMEWLGFSKDINGEWEFSKVTLGTIIGAIVGAGGLLLGVKKVYDFISGIANFIGLIGGAGGVASTGGTLLTTIGNLAKTVGTFMSGPIGWAALLVTTSLIAEAMWKNSDATYKASNMLTLWNGASEETKTHLQNFQGAVDELQSKIDYFTYSGLKMSDEDYNEILGSLLSLKEAFGSELDKWYVEQKNALDELYSWEGAKDSESYKNRLAELQGYYTDNMGQFNDYYNEYVRLLKEAYKNDGIIDNEERLKLLDIQAKMQQLSIESFAKSNDEKQRLLENYFKRADEMSMKDALNALKIAREKYEEQEKAISEYYDKLDEMAQEQYGKGTDDYNEYMEELKIATEKMSEDNLAEYDSFYDRWAGINDKLAEYTDKTTGTLGAGYIQMFGGLDGAIIAIGESMEGNLDDTLQHMIDTVKENGGKILDAFEMGKAKNFGYNVMSEVQKGANSFGAVTFKLKPTGSGADLLSNANLRAEGGFVNSGEIFIANENNRPEYIGRFGNQTAVANNDQIVEGIEGGVTRAMYKVMSSVKLGNDQPIYNKVQIGSDTIMDWFQSEEKRQERQYGF